MDIRQIDETYHVSPQITPEDAAAIAAAGFTTVICNRPDAEIPPALHAEVVRAAAEEAGLEFHVLPLTHQTMTPDNIAAQTELLTQAAGKVLAYCASGTRCSVVWSLGQAMSGARSTDDILAATRAAGYDLAPLRPQLDALAGG